jgi:hypothetical protein
MSTQPQPQVFEAPALLIEARHRDRVLCARLLCAESGAAFTVGPGRRADAPVDPRFLPPDLPANDNHALVTPSAAGFFVNLSPAMGARCVRTPTHLRVPVGEVIFDISAAAPAAVLPRSWLRPGWEADARVTGAVALGLALLLLLVRAVPSDPHALSLDDVGRSIRLDGFRLLAPVVVEPAHVPGARAPAGGGAITASAGPRGAAGDRAARSADARRETKGPAVRQDARDVESYVRRNTMLAVIDGTRTGTLAAVLGDAPALGSDRENVLGHLVGTTMDTAWGRGLGPDGTGARGADTGVAMLGGPPGLGTLGRFAGADGPSRGYGDDVGGLGTRKPHKIEVTIEPAVVRGSLDKELVRRVVRQHLNEVRYCYEQALPRRPALAGRVVAQFTIAPTGRVLVAALQSSSLGDSAVESCIVEATRRWPFPQPAGGGIVIVSYPFQLAPVGG